MLNLFDAQYRRFEYFATVIQNIQDLTNQGHESMITGLNLYWLEAENIEQSFTWIATVFQKEAQLAKMCCSFVMHSMPFLVNYAPSKKLEWLCVAYDASQLLSKDIQFKILMEMGSAYWFQGDYQISIITYKQLLQETNHTADLAEAYGLMGLVYKDLGEFDTAIGNLLKALELIEGKKKRSIYLPILGRCYHHIGQFQLAFNAYHESLIIAQQIGDLRGEADIKYNIGLLFVESSDYDKSLEFFEQGLEITKKIFDRRGESNHLNGIATTMLCAKIFDEAINYAQEALKICIETENRKGIAKNSFVLAQCYLHKGIYFIGIAYLFKTFELHRQMKSIKKMWKLLPKRNIVFEPIFVDKVK